MVVLEVLLNGSGGAGAGNPGGWGTARGKNGTGGLLILYGKEINNLGVISSNGSYGGGLNEGSGGSSGGGSINIFYKDTFKNENSIKANGVRSNDGGSGGNGTVTIGNISTGSFVKD